MPRLRVLAGPSPDCLVPITANSNEAHPIKSDLFDGQVVVHIKGFPDPEGNVLDSEYFGRADRQNTTWSIQVQGRFLQTCSADDIMFGNTFDRPLKLPWGSGAALKFMKFIDPTLQHDLTSKTRPWALSPLISTMPYFVHTALSSAELSQTYSSDSSDSSSEDAHSFPAPLHTPQLSTPPPPFPSSASLVDDVTQLRLDKKARKGSASRKEVSKLSTSSQRRTYFSMQDKRKTVTFGPEDVITTDFCYGFIQFPSLSLCLPGGISFDLTKYWDGQPVRFVCCERAEPGQNPVDARSFWCVAIEKVGDD